MRGLSAAFALLLVCLAGSGAAEEVPGETIVTAPGDTLYALIRIYYPDERTRWTQIGRDIVRLNPHAFSGGDPGSLRLGEAILLPYYEDESQEQAATDEAAGKDAGAQAGSAVGKQQPRAAAATVLMGTVAEIEGSVEAGHDDTEPRQLAAGDPVHSGDVLRSGPAASLRLVMTDSTELFLREKSRLVLADYAFDALSPERGRCALSLSYGGLRVITGMIGQLNPGEFEVRTPLASIGVRGTDFGVRVCDEEGCSVPGVDRTLPQGAYVGVIDGAVNVRVAGGETLLSRGEFARVLAQETAPQPTSGIAAVVFTGPELAMLESEREKPLGFWQWLVREFADGVR